MNRLWLDIQSLTANAFHNWEHVRLYESSTTERRPGFTESWGDGGNDEASSSVQPPWGWSLQRQGNLLVEKDDKQPANVGVVVVQYRPAWAVQLALRAASIPHSVMNSPYAVCEATGPLPYLRNDDALVGGGNNNQSILDYLVETKQITLLDVSSSETSMSSSMEMLLRQVITETLANVLKVLRYHDNHTWKAVERPKSLKACHGNWFMGHWHVWAERQTALASLSRDYHSYSRNANKNTTEQAVHKAQKAYAYLEHVMQTTPEVFLHRHFSRVGLALFQHVMEALADATLVTLLHQYPALCRYGQNVWEQYFAAESDNNIFYDAPNEDNAFFLLPTTATWTPAAAAIVVDKNRQDDQFWQTRLTILARQAASLAVKPQRRSVHVETVSNDSNKSTRAESTAQAAVAAYQTADQRWMASVLLLAVVVFARTLGQADSNGGQ